VRPPAVSVAGRVSGLATEIDEREARRSIAELLSSGYVEITAAERALLLRASGRSEEQLKKESSLQVVLARNRAYCLISPSDPLFSVISRSRSGGSSSRR
jgi:hypothetical protein